MEYFHKPINIPPPGLNLCQGVVIGITNYAGREREFVIKLAEQIGMLAQEIFAKRDKANAVKSTHLVCNKPEGAKYEAAIKWGLPVVSAEWILACQR